MREPSGWHLRPLGEMLESIQAGRSPDLEDTPAGPGQWGVLKVNSVHPSGFRSGENKAVTDRTLIKPELEVQRGDLIFSRANTMELVGLCCIAEDPKPKLMLSDKTLRIKPKRAELAPSFLLAVLSSAATRRQIHALATGTSGSMKNIGQEAVRLVVVPHPPLEEQQRIMDVLNALDEETLIVQRTLLKLRSMQWGILSDAIVGDWVMRPLEELGEIAAGVTLGSEPWGTASVELPYLRVANVQDGRIDTSDVKMVRVLRTQVDRYRLRAGDVLMTEGGDFDKLGRGAVWDSRIPICLHQNHVFRVRPDDRRLSSDYLSLYIGSSAGRRYFLSVAKQTTNLASINSTQLRRMPVPVPPRDEQERVMRPVREVRAQIEAKTAELVKLRLMKQGLTEDLLSGKVRVPG